MRTPPARNLVFAIYIAANGACYADPADSGEIDYSQQSIIGGDAALPGEFEAVPRVGNGGGTLITPWAILTAGHLVCRGTGLGPEDCYDRMQGDVPTTTTKPGPIFEDLIPEGDVRVAGKIYPHPGFYFYDRGTPDEQDDIIFKDLALILLDDGGTVPERVRIEHYADVDPIPVAGDSLWGSWDEPFTLVGYGWACGGGQKTSGSVKLPGPVYINGDAGPTESTYLHFVDDTIGACQGDSGGPAISTLIPAVVGVAHSGNSLPPFMPPYESEYVYTEEEIDWLSKYKCPGVDPSSHDPDFCSYPGCPCYAAEGNCKNDYECVFGSGLSCIPNIGVKARLDSTDDLCWSPLVAVQVCDGEFRLPPKMSIVEGAWSSFSPLASDTISSLGIPWGYSVSVCTPSGVCQNFIRDVDSLPPTLNNKPLGQIVVNPGNTFSRNSGALRTWRGDGWFLNTSVKTDLGGNPVETINIAPGVVVEHCSAIGTCSQRYVQSSTVPTTPGSQPNFWHVAAGVTLYSGRGFTGKIDGFPKRTAPYVGTDPVWFHWMDSNEVASVVVAPGLEAEICWGSQDCVTYTRWTSIIDVDHLYRSIESITVRTSQNP